jgi:exopolysaccharide biosynthesis polyprenyl glycosylphosphotransferase
MLRNQREYTQLWKQINDVLICWVAFLLAYALRPHLKWLPSVDLPSLTESLWLPATSLFVHFYVYHALGLYESLRHTTALQLLGRSAKAAIAEVFILGAVIFLFQQFSTSRGLFLIYVVLNAVLLFASRVTARTVASSTRGRFYNYRRVVLVGPPHELERHLPDLERESAWGLLVRGWVSPSGTSELFQGRPALGNLTQLESILMQEATDEVLFVLEDWNGAQLREALMVCERLGVHARLSLEFLGSSRFKANVAPLGDATVLTFYSHWMTPTEAFAKRAFDIFAALSGLAVAALFFPWIYWRIQRESPGPVIFRQARVGENGRTFRCYKFRSMHLDAEARKAELLGQNEMQGPIFKLKEDPRVFPFGKFLRSSSLDELPQFLNILRGEMSLVGPRPPTPEEVESYEPRFRRRFSVRPGLTGLWQVSGRSKLVRFEDILDLDLKYIDQWSLWLDLKIVVQTFWVLIQRRGAY